MLRKRKGESLPKLLKTYEELIKADAKLAFCMHMVRLKGPITKPIEIQKKHVNIVTMYVSKIIL